MCVAFPQCHQLFVECPMEVCCFSSMSSVVCGVPYGSVLLFLNVISCLWSALWKCVAFPQCHQLFVECPMEVCCFSSMSSVVSGVPYGSVLLFLNVISCLWSAL